MVATWPADTKDGWWRYRLKGSTLLGHDPAEPLKEPVDAAQLKAFYQKWYTPDAMTLVRGGQRGQPRGGGADQQSVSRSERQTGGTRGAAHAFSAAAPAGQPD